MTRSRAAFLWLVLASAAASLVGLAVTFDAQSASRADFTAFAVPLAAMALLEGTVGVLVLMRRPGSVVGRLMAVGPLVMLGGFSGYAIGTTRSLVAGPDDVLGGLAATWGAATVIPGIFLAYPAVVLLFPNGHLPSRRWRLVVGPLVVALAAGALLTLVAPNEANLRRGDGSGLVILPANPIAIATLPPEVSAGASAMSAVALIVATVLAAASALVRFRRARGIERQQLKWLLAAGAVAGLLFPISFGTEIGPAGLIDVASVLAVALIPVAIGVAILRYRLYDIDRLVSRTLSWTVVSVVLAGVFIAGLVGLQTLLADVTGGGTLAVASSTLVAFALFQPVRRRVQAVVDRRFNRSRYDADRLAASFGERVRNAIDPDATGASLVATASAAVHPTSARVWLRPGR